MKQVLVLLFLFSPWAFADKYFVETVRGSATDDDKASVEELVRISVPQAGHTVAATKEQANYTLSPSILKLGESYVLTIQKKDKSGQAVFSEKMKAKAMDEMDNVASRLTKAVINQTVLADTQDVTNVTAEEQSQNSRRLHATRQWIIGLGPGWSNNTHSKGGGFTFQLGYQWGLDPDFAINLAWTGNNGRKGDSSSFSDFSLGGEYHLTRTRFSPFVGARLGFGSAVTNTDNCGIFTVSCTQDRASGWTTNLTAGYKLFRTSSVNAAVFVSYYHLWDKTSAGEPSLVTTQIAVYY